MFLAVAAKNLIDPLMADSYEFSYREAADSCFVHCENSFSRHFRFTLPLNSFWLGFSRLVEFVKRGGPIRPVAAAGVHRSCTQIIAVNMDDGAARTAAFPYRDAGRTQANDLNGGQPSKRLSREAFSSRSWRHRLALPASCYQQRIVKTHGCMVARIGVRQDGEHIFGLKDSGVIRSIVKRLRHHGDFRGRGNNDVFFALCIPDGKAHSLHTQASIADILDLDKRYLWLGA